MNQIRTSEIVRDLFAFSGLGMVVVGFARISTEAAIIAIGSILWLLATFCFRNPQQPNQ